MTNKFPQMVQVATFDDFRKINSLFAREHDRLFNKYNINFISLKGVKLPLICLYKFVFTLFKNNSINLKISDVILLTVSAIGLLSKENKDDVKKLLITCKEKKILRYFIIVKNTLKSIKTLLNIILKKDTVITNLEQGLKHRDSNNILSLALTFIKINNIKIKDFCFWYIVDKRNKESYELIDYININYS